MAPSGGGAVNGQKSRQEAGGRGVGLKRTPEAQAVRRAQRTYREAHQRLSRCMTRAAEELAEADLRAAARNLRVAEDHALTVGLAARQV